MAVDGSIEIVGTIDVSQIKEGLNQVTFNLKDVSDSAKTAKSDLVGLDNSLSVIGSKLVAIGLAANAAIIGLASMSPAVAPTMARMQVSLFEIGVTIGDVLKPAFESFADLMSGFGEWLNSPNGIVALELLNSTFEGTISVLRVLGGVADKVFKVLGDLVGLVGGVGDFVIDLLPVDDDAKSGLKQGWSDFLSPSGFFDFVSGVLSAPFDLLGANIDFLGSVLSGDIKGGFDKFVKMGSGALTFGLFDSGDSWVDDSADRFARSIFAFNSRYLNDSNMFKYLGK